MLWGVWSLAAGGLWPPLTTVLEIASDAGLIFLVGGLATLAFILALVSLSSIFPAQSSGTETQVRPPPHRELRPLLGPRSRVRPQRASHSLDQIMAVLVEDGRGEPRILHHGGGVIRIKLYHCSECCPEVVGDNKAGRSQACDEQRDLIKDAMRVLRPPPRAIRETRCTLRGDDGCIFEVRR